MSGERFIDTHRTWEDWVGMLLGILIAVSPWMNREANYGLGLLLDPGLALINTAVVGVLIIGLSQLEYLALCFGLLDRWRAEVLACRSRRRCVAARSSQALARLGVVRSGHGPARTIT